MGVIAATATSPDGAGNLGAIIAVILGMLGGTFFPIGQGNDLLARLSYLTPHAWFMRGLADHVGWGGVDRGSAGGWRPAPVHTRLRDAWLGCCCSGRLTQ